MERSLWCPLPPQILRSPSFYSTLLFASQRGDGASSAASSVDPGVTAVPIARVANLERRLGTEFIAINHKARTLPPAAAIPATHACVAHTFELLSHPLPRCAGPDGVVWHCDSTSSFGTCCVGCALCVLQLAPTHSAALDSFDRSRADRL